jgi:hypothetical protein
MSFERLRGPEFQAALDAVLASSTFMRAERLKRFLSFVCDLVLAGRGEEINEYLIGIEVFDRPAEYSPGEDSIVRRQAHALRKKLDEYYQGEGKDTRIRIELPLGHYAAVFRVVEEAVVKEASAPVRPWRRWGLTAGLTAAVAVIVFLAGWLAGHVARADAVPMSASMHWLWQPWLNDASGVTICLTNPRTIVVKYYPQAHPQSPIEAPVPSSSPRDRSLREFFSLPAAGELSEYPSVGQAKMGEAVAAIRLASLLSAHHVPVRVEPASFLEWNHARSDNLIVFGHSESSPWVDRLLAGYPIRTQASEGSLPKRITVAAPRSGERSIYAVNQSDPEDLYVLISMVPGLDGEHRLLAVSGLSGMAAQFGAEYLTTPSHVEALAEALRKAGADPSQPIYFQAVLQVNVHKNSIPLKGRIELVRLIRRTPQPNLAVIAPVTGLP